MTSQAPAANDDSAPRDAAAPPLTTNDAMDDQAAESAVARPPAGLKSADHPIPDGPTVPVAEIGGRSGPDPTRYGDWEMRGRCIDF